MKKEHKRTTYNVKWCQQLVSTWFSIGFNMVLGWSQARKHVAPKMVSTWFSTGFNMVMAIQIGFNMDLDWFQHGYEGGNDLSTRVLAPNYRKQGPESP